MSRYLISDKSSIFLASANVSGSVMSTLLPFAPGDVGVGFAPIQALATVLQPQGEVLVTTDAASIFVVREDGQLVAGGAVQDVFPQIRGLGPD